MTTLPTVAISKEEPRLFRGNNVEEDAQRMLENGYVMVGYSSFNAGNVNVNGALAQAKQVHAAVVLIYSKYTNTVSGLLPLTLPDTQTSSTSLSGSAHGSGGYTTYSGMAHTTTYGIRTTYVPYSMDRHDYLTTYWIKLKPSILGVQTQDLTTEIRQKIGSNRGVFVYAVIKDSPAFREDILKGDILRKVGDIDIYDVKSFQETIGRYAGQKVRVEILREGKEI